MIFFAKICEFFHDFQMSIAPKVIVVEQRLTIRWKALFVGILKLGLHFMCDKNWGSYGWFYEAAWKKNGKIFGKNLPGIFPRTSPEKNPALLSSLGYCHYMLYGLPRRKPPQRVDFQPFLSPIGLIFTLLLQYTLLVLHTVLYYVAMFNLISNSPQSSLRLTITK